tara:strand:- start:415 stop:651 length:237 start_codon:yes stop_codon:yes gene_type:complete
MRDFPTVQEYMDAKYKEYAAWNMQPLNHGRSVQDFLAGKNPVIMREPTRPTLPSKAQLFDSAETSRAAMRNRVTSEGK